MTVRAKFAVESIKKFRYGYHQLELTPVYADDGPNKSWSEATPSGKIEMTVTNEKALDFFTVGKEYIIDFREAAEGE